MCSHFVFIFFCPCSTGPLICLCVWVYNVKLFFYSHRKQVRFHRSGLFLFPIFSIFISKFFFVKKKFILLPFDMLPNCSCYWGWFSSYLLRVFFICLEFEMWPQNELVIIMADPSFGMACSSFFQYVDYFFFFHFCIIRSGSVVVLGWGLWSGNIWVSFKCTSWIHGFNKSDIESHMHTVRAAISFVETKTRRADFSCTVILFSGCLFKLLWMAKL